MNQLKNPTSVSAYINAAPIKGRKYLKQMRKCIRSEAPGAKEELKWGMPAFSYSRILVIYGAFKNHIGFYPTTSAIKKFSKELKKYKGARGSVQFPYDESLPLSLIKKIVKFRVKENREQNAKWKERAQLREVVIK